MQIQYPYSEQAERAVLGAMLMDAKAVTICVSTLYDEDFYVPNHKKIYQAIKNAVERGTVVDITTITNELEDLRYLDDIGGIQALVDLTESVVITNVDYYIDVLKDKANLRDFAKFLEKTIKDFDKSGQADVNLYLNEIEKEILTITRNRRVGEFKQAKEIVREIHNKIKAGKKARSGYDTGFSKLTAKLQGWHAGDLVILAARPGVGKSALALNFAYQTARIEKKPVAFFSLEMSSEQMILRMLAACGMIENDKLKQMKFDQRDFVKFEEASKKLSEVAIYFDDTPNINLADLQNKARKLKEANPSLAMIVVDYLNLIKVSSRKDRHLEVGEITQALKGLARELEVPVIALAQLSRRVEQRGAKSDNRPNLSDLRESGSIEQDADIVMFIYREDYYQKADEETKESSVPVELIVAKHRNGDVGTINLVFSKPHSRFYSADKE